MEPTNFSKNIPINADTVAKYMGYDIFSKEHIKNVIKITNNKAEAAAKRAAISAKKSKESSELSEYYSQQNANLTQGELEKLENKLEAKINAKQDCGDYALNNDLPTKVSQLENNMNYVTQQEMQAAHNEIIEELSLPDMTGNSGKVLFTDGENPSWKKIHCANLFETRLFDHVLSGEESFGWALQGTYVYKESIAEVRCGYPDFYAKCLEEKNAGVATQTTLGNSTITTYNNENGHIYYDISNKNVVDAFFNTYGACWMYGIDTENESIFLPRNNWFEQGATSNPGSFINAGLPNITGTVSSHENALPGATGAFSLDGYSGQNNYHNSGNTGNMRASINFNAALSNSIYGSSNTVQPKAIKKLLYICVGNTTVESTVTNVTELTTSENDTIPLGYSIYQKDAQPSPAWLASNGQWNTEEMYSTFYYWLIAQKSSRANIKEHTETYTDYDFVINQENNTFRLPLLDGSENLISGDFIKYTNPTSSAHTYSATYNGLALVQATSTANNQYIKITNSNTAEVDESRSPSTSAANVCSVWVNKGDSFSITGDNLSTVYDVRLLKAKGNGTLYFKVSNAVQNLALLDVAGIANTIASKTDIEQAAVASLPSNEVIPVTWGASSAFYLSPCDGWFYASREFALWTTECWMSCTIRKDNNPDSPPIYSVCTNGGGTKAITIPIRKGQYVRVGYNSAVNSTAVALQFIKAQGEV